MVNKLVYFYAIQVYIII